MCKYSFYFQSKRMVHAIINNKDRIKKLLLDLIKLVVIFSMVTGTSSAQGNQEIFLNGERLTGDEIVLFEQLAGTHLPSGSYWANFETGQWGSMDSSVSNESSTPANQDNRYFEDRMFEDYGVTMPSTVIYQ